LKIEPMRSSQDMLEQQWKLIVISSVSFLVFFLSHVLFNLRRANTWVDYLLACLSGLAVGGLIYPFAGPYYAVPVMILWGLFSSFFILFMERFTVESSCSKRERLSGKQSQKGGKDVGEYWISSTKETFKKALVSSVEDIKSFFSRIRKELSYLFQGGSIKSKNSGENVKNSEDIKDLLHSDIKSKNSGENVKNSRGIKKLLSVLLVLFVACLIASRENAKNSKDIK
ncbi:MAG: hypothetical protein NZM25_02350, partial [Leptospiraceae bacterium]|nr:hypothetical protein [Leptospiraceae bacterium]